MLQRALDVHLEWQEHALGVGDALEVLLVVARARECHQNVDVAQTVVDGTEQELGQNVLEDVDDVVALLQRLRNINKKIKLTTFIIQI